MTLWWLPQPSQRDLSVEITFPKRYYIYNYISCKNIQTNNRKWWQPILKSNETQASTILQEESFFCVSKPLKPSAVSSCGWRTCWSPCHSPNVATSAAPAEVEASRETPVGVRSATPTPALAGRVSQHLKMTSNLQARTKLNKQAKVCCPKS
jgi:hypothetical protein